MQVNDDGYGSLGHWNSRVVGKVKANNCPKFTATFKLSYFKQRVLSSQFLSITDGKLLEITSQKVILFVNISTYEHFLKTLGLYIVHRVFFKQYCRN